MERFVEVLKNCDDFDCLRGVPFQQIHDAENQLDVSFSEEYRQYLQEFGIASANGHEFTGICNSPRLNVVNVTREARRMNPEVPEGYYVVEKAGIDGIIIWQDSTGAVILTKPHSAMEKAGGSLVEYFCGL